MTREVSAYRAELLATLGHAAPACPVGAPVAGEALPGGSAPVDALGWHRGPVRGGP